MKHIFILFFYLALWNAAPAQSVEHVQSVRIEDHFDALNIQAYGLSGQGKVEELFEYLNLLHSSENTEALRNQISQNIAQLFSKEILKIQGLTTKTYYAAPMLWIKEFTGVSHFQLSCIKSQLQDTFWIYTYKLTYIQNSKAMQREMEVKMQFAQHNKRFGSSSKTVWQLAISEILFSK